MNTDRHLLALHNFGVDLNQLAERLCGDESLVPEVCGIFVGDAPRLTTNLDAALASADLHAIAEATHAIKGAVRNFTSGAILVRAETAEQASRRGDLALAVRLATPLPGLVRELAAALALVARGEILQ